MVDVWQCDALGVYPGVGSTSGQKFLRGYQNTDASGSAKFMTIYPGWYQGRAVHIHFKIRPTSSSEFTSQLFFDDALSTQVFAQAPYSQKGTQGITRNTSDGIFQQSAGKLLAERDEERRRVLGDLRYRPRELTPCHRRGRTPCNPPDSKGESRTAPLAANAARRLAVR